ncbi:polyketide synthase regulator [Microbacterium sp. MYb72]|uniref:PucR family transcriptional regulator n=1 Tax=Microbacterium sp. MYb72 TaxID=1848693 RepID=UPI000CFCC35F|nr:helix-turn-helix domain-containing protein [Microbacterium sp. MYb72]PRB08724.1 polyketide synthase regulator [Microbacterium sp. MYb72]
MNELLLSALLAHAENGGLRLVAGPSDASWSAVSVEAGEADLREHGDGRLAVLTSAAPATTWQQDALLRRVRDRGFTGLALPGASGMDAGALRLADRLGLTLLDVVRPVQLAKACWMLIEARDALTLSQVRKVAQSFEYSADDLADLLRHISANLGLGVALVEAGTVIHEAGDHLDEGLLAAIGYDSWIDRTRTTAFAAASVRVDSPGRSGLRLVLFGHGLSDAQLLALSVAAEVAMPAVAARLLIDEVAAVNDVAVSSGLLRDFVDIRGAADIEVARRMAERGWRTSGHHLGFRMVARGRLDPFSLLRSISSDLAAVDAEAHATTTGRGIGGWLTFADAPSPERVERAVAALRELHAAALRDFTIATGVGSLQSGPEGLAATLDEAADAARIAAARSATGWFVRVDSLGLDQLLLAWTGTDTFVPAAQSLLAPLQEGGGELLSTLSAYLDNESGIAATAAALGLHRNTVAVRIRRVQELLGIDMADPEARLALHLACRAVQPR